MNSILDDASERWLRPDHCTLELVDSSCLWWFPLSPAWNAVFAEFCSDEINCRPSVCTEHLAWLCSFDCFIFELGLPPFGKLFLKYRRLLNCPELLDQLFTVVLRVIIRSKTIVQFLSVKPSNCCHHGCAQSVRCLSGKLAGDHTPSSQAVLPSWHRERRSFGGSRSKRLLV